MLMETRKFPILKASIGLGEHGLNTSPKLGTYTPLPYLVVFQRRLPIFEIRFELRCFQLLSKYGVATQHALSDS